MYELKLKRSFNGKILTFSISLLTKDEAEDTVINTDKLIFIELGEDSPVTVTFPSKYPHGFFGITDTAVIINYRNPAWNPKDTYQFDIECEKTVKILNDKYYKARI